MPHSIEHQLQDLLNELADHIDRANKRLHGLESRVTNVEHQTTQLKSVLDEPISKNLIDATKGLAVRVTTLETKQVQMDGTHRELQDDITSIRVELEKV